MIRLVFFQPNANSKRLYEFTLTKSLRCFPENLIKGEKLDKKRKNGCSLFTLKNLRRCKKDGG